MKKNIAVILAQGFEEVEAVTPIDLLRRAGIQVTVVGQKSMEVTGAHDITFKADTLLEHFPGCANGIILPGGMPGTMNLAESEKVIKLVQTTFHSGALCAAICAAPLVFEKANILKGRRFTCFPEIDKQIQSGFFLEESVIVDGNVITSRGLGTAIDFSLAIIEYLLDKETALKIAQKVIYKKGQ